MTPTPSARGPLERLAGLPLPVALMAGAALAMQIPALHAAATRAWELARIFLWSGVALAVLAALLGLALAGHRPRRPLRAQMAALVGAYLALPLLLALPFWLAVEEAGPRQAWFEMVSALTTTGATLWTDPAQLPPTLHLWRACVGWMGGFLIWVAAAAIFQPLNLGGFEVLAEDNPASERMLHLRRLALAQRTAEGGGPRRAAVERLSSVPAGPVGRIPRVARQLLPIWLGLTGALWLALVVAGDPELVALCHAMSTLSTSGISPLPGGIAAAPSGRLGEGLVLLFLVFALSRSTFTARHPRALPRDPELRLGLGLILGVTAVLFLRLWLGALQGAEGGDAGEALRSLWGLLFSTASFLTTTGFVPADWIGAERWSGLAAPGLILTGLAALGGGVATAAGGAKLLRVLALWKHGQHELERLVEPHALSGAAAQMRRIRGRGAQRAWLAFVALVLALALCVLLLTALGQDLQPALILSAAALSTTGQVADVAGAVPLAWDELGPAAQGVLALAMVAGRIEALAVLALLSPGFWRR